MHDDAVMRDARSVASVVLLLLLDEEFCCCLDAYELGAGGLRLEGWDSCKQVEREDDQRFSRCVSMCVCV